MGNDIDAEHLCSVIKNLRLFANTDKEWQEKYGHLYKRKEKKQLLTLLDAQCKKDFDDDFDLYDFMNDYRQSCKDGFIGRHKRDVILTNEDNLLALMRYQFMPKGTLMSRELEGRKDLEGFLACEPVLLLLWSIVDHESHTKALPFFDERPGDVDMQSYEFFISELRRLLLKIYPERSILGKVSPVIVREFRKIKSKLKAKTIVKMDLVILVYNVLSNVIINCNNDELYYVSKELLRKDIISPDICGDGVWWIDPCRAPLNQVFVFIKGEMGYSLFRFDLKTCKYVAYTVIFYTQKGAVCANVIHPKSVVNLMKGEPMADGVYMTCNVDIGYHNDVPDTIKFSTVTGDVKDVPKTLKRTSDGEMAKLWRGFDDCDFESFEYEFPEYDYDKRNVERLISADYIFVERDCVETDDGRRKVTSWFRIPRHANTAWNIDQIQADDQIFHIRLLGEEYLYFDPLNLSLKVTTAQNLAEQHIDVMAVPSYETEIDADE